jgi:hypothetical protein
MANNTYGGLCAPRHALLLVIAVLIFYGDLALHIQPDQPQAGK